MGITTVVSPSAISLLSTPRLQTVLPRPGGLPGCRCALTLSTSPHWFASASSLPRAGLILQLRESWRTSAQRRLALVIANYPRTPWQLSAVCGFPASLCLDRDTALSRRHQENLSRGNTSQHGHM